MTYAAKALNPDNHDEDVPSTSDGETLGGDECVVDHVDLAS